MNDKFLNSVENLHKQIVDLIILCISEAIFEVNFRLFNDNKGETICLFHLSDFEEIEFIFIDGEDITIRLVDYGKFGAMEINYNISSLEYRINAYKKYLIYKSKIKFFKSLYKLLTNI